MSTEEADRYRESLRQNQDFLDDETRAIIEREHLLDPPTTAPLSPAPPAVDMTLAHSIVEEALAQEAADKARRAGPAVPFAHPVEPEDEPPPPRSRLIVLILAIAGVFVLVAGLVTTALISRSGQPTAPSAGASTPTARAPAAKTPAPPALSATVTGSYSGSFTIADSKCYSNGYLLKYEEDYLLKASDGTLWLVNIVPDLSGSTGFFFAEQTADHKPDPAHTYWGYGSGPGQSVTITPGQGGSVSHDLFIINTNTPAGHLQMIGTCPAGSPTS